MQTILLTQDAKYVYLLNNLNALSALPHLT